MIVAVCCASRGLMHSRTMEACLSNLKEAQVDWLTCFSHDKPIPEAQNSITDKALASAAEWLWYLEEDVIPPSNALRTMLPEAKVITAKYRNRGGTWAFSQDSNGRLRYAGMGCLLVHRSVFSRLKVPYFECNYYWDWNSDGTVRSRHAEPGGYGRQDIHFFAQLWQAGEQVRMANIVCQHAHVVRPGQPETNQGCHEIEII